MKVGVDLSHVFCTHGAATVIKTYSPELIVLPYLPDSNDAERHQEQHMQELIATWLKKMQCLVIGPGLGDDPMVVSASKHMLQQARQNELPILVDGSGLNFVAKEPNLVSGYKRCILTPNLAEFGRLAEGVGLQLPGSITPQWQEHTQSLAAAFGGVTVLSKGPIDTISDGVSTTHIDLPAGLKRAGGQGDVLTGATAAFMCWVQLHAKNNDGADLGMSPMMLAACGGSAITRRASHYAFEDKGRALLAGDVVDRLHQAFLHFFKE
jgi:ATP-dependent NAD(P)H-hydrate dehydratase